MGSLGCSRRPQGRSLNDSERSHHMQRDHHDRSININLQPRRRRGLPNHHNYFLDLAGMRGDHKRGNHNLKLSIY